MPIHYAQLNGTPTIGGTYSATTSSITPTLINNASAARYIEVSIYSSSTATTALQTKITSQITSGSSGTVTFSNLSAATTYYIKARYTINSSSSTIKPSAYTALDSMETDSVQT